MKVLNGWEQRERTSGKEPAANRTSRIEPDDRPNVRKEGKRNASTTIDRRPRQFARRSRSAFFAIRFHSRRP